MFGRSQIEEGMTVRSSDGEKLGRVYAIGDSEFFIEKGLFFPKDYACRYSDIADIRNGEVFLSYGKESLTKLSEAAPAETYETQRTTAGIGTSPTATTPLAGARVGEEVSIPVHHEELDVLKRETQQGEVVVNKTVVEEEETMQVPLRRERAVVERRDVADRPAMAADAFQEETVRVPLRAEEIEARKRTVVDEEVVIRKDAIEEEHEVSAPLRREEVEIRGAKPSEESRKLDLSSDKEPGKL